MALRPGSKSYVEKIEQINRILIELASGNFETEIIPSDDKDELDAIIAGINMLREELVHSTVSTEFLESIYNGIVDMLVIVTPKFKIQTINEIVRKNLEYSEDELLGKPFYKLVEDICIEEVSNYNKELKTLQDMVIEELNVENIYK